jgi:hypothetical protein
MTLKFDELMKMNLKGFKYNDSYQGMTMTSRNAWVDDFYIVIEDDGEKCIVTNLESRTFKRTWSKNYVASKIASCPLVKWDEESKSHVNDIEVI